MYQNNYGMTPPRMANPTTAIPNFNYNLNLDPRYYQPQPQQSPQFEYSNPIPSGLQGRIVQREEEIAPSEVPMDGTISIFPSIDGSCIYTKTWNKDGSINTEIYVKYVPPKQEELETIPVQDNSSIILERLDKIEKMIAKNTYKKPYNNKKNTNRGVKENVQ